MSSDRTVARLTRLLSMVPWVVANPGASVDEVRDRFGYPTKAELIRDLGILFVCGLPGYGPGDLMDMSVDDDEVYIDMADYFSRPIRLTAPEALMLLSAGTAVLSAEVTPPPALESAVTKLRAVIAPSEVFDVDIDPSPEVAKTLRQTVGESQVVRITHTSLAGGRTTTRLIEPWKVFTTLGNWYVVGYCRTAEAQRVFRIDRIHDAEAVDEHFDPPGEVPDETVVYRPGPDDTLARIRLSERAAWVTDYYPVEVLERPADGSILIVFAASDPSVTARLLLRLGDDAELIDGPAVEPHLDAMRDRILERYDAL